MEVFGLDLIVDCIVMMQTNKGTQVYTTLPFAPQTEIIWSQKDEFQAWVFFVRPYAL